MELRASLPGKQALSEALVKIVCSVHRPYAVTGLIASRGANLVAYRSRKTLHMAPYLVIMIMRVRGHIALRLASYLAAINMRVRGNNA